MKIKLSLQGSESKASSRPAPHRGALSPRIAISTILAIAAGLAPPASGQDDAPEEFDLFEPVGTFLNPVVVTANKYSQPASNAGSTVTYLEGEALEQSQIRSLENALRLAPGVITASSGARGSITSVFMRGTESDHTQVIVDGIRVSDSNILPAPFLGAENLHNIGSVEVLRGPQGALYGGEAIGGVISLTTRRGEGEPTFSLFGEAGSFGTALGGVSGQGEVGGIAYAFSAGGETTQNERPNNDFQQYQSSLRLDFQAGEDTTLGFTFRQANRKFGSPGDVVMNDPDNFERDDTVLLSSHIESRVNDLWTTRLILGTVLQEFQSVRPPMVPLVTGPKSSRIVTDWRNIFEFSEQHTTLLGAGMEHTSIEDAGFGNIDETERILSLYGQHTLELTEAFALTGGLRYEEYTSFGHIWTHRATATYAFEKTGTRFHGSYGTGFRPPAFLDLFGMEAPHPIFGGGFTGNPALVPEESTGWDLGIEQRIGSSHLLDVTWFHNDIENLIAFDFSMFPAPGTTVNVAEATTEGFEVALRGAGDEILNYSLAYTYLDANNETANTRLLRRPRHTLGFDVNAQVCERLLLGIGGHLVRDRTDIDARMQTFKTIKGDDYFLARAYASYALAENVSLNFRLENAFDEEYDEVDGFPGLGFGAFAGLRIEF